jgi:flagellar M-ring protein FliF
MNQLTRIWNSLSTQQRFSLIFVPLIAVAIVYGLVKWKHDSDFRVLYNSLSPEDASAITQKMREGGIEYRLDETGATVLVPSAQIAEARLALAGAGLPKTGRIGFELFDRTNLGASDFAEQINYRRALEGELERTVGTLTEVEQARIHITFAKESVFLDARQPSKATVVLRLRRGVPLPQPSVVAIANLVASAVDGLAPDGVAIIDAGGHLLSRPRAQGDAEAQLASANLDYQRQIESEFVAKVGAALEPLLGPDRFRVGVNVECDFSSSEESQESVDPAKSAILTSQTTEESSGGAASLGGTPGTESNLPRPPVRTAGAGSAGILRQTANTTYQPSRTVKRIVSPRGSVRRVSTAVLLDQTVRWEGAGAKARKILVPPSADTIKAVHDMIASITGYNEPRGDQITVETLPFENTLAAEPPVPNAPPAKTPPVWSFKQPLVIGAAVASILLIVLIAGAVFLLTRRRPGALATDTAAVAVPASDPAQAAITAMQTAESRMEKLISEQAAQQAALEAEALSRIKLPANTKQTEVLVRHIRDSVQKDPVSSTNVLRTWISDLDTKRTS